MSFDGSDPVSVQQLSGGQKTVVAVAMIFAVLKMESAPYYILDEFDHALDTQYRKAIASLIEELSKKSQFLITTFKPELLEIPASIFEVRYRSRSSKVIAIDRGQAADIL